MFFNKLIGLEEINSDNANIIHREAVRAVIVENNKILMVYTNKGDYKFPGGGVKEGEDQEEAIKREVEEETGYIIEEVKDKIGIITQRHFDKFEKNSVFQMTSNYYLCSLCGKKTSQCLDNYEAELEFQPVWIDLQQAIHENENIAKHEDKNPWVDREIYVLKKLQQCQLIGGR